MNLTELKAAAEAAKASPLELDFWREDISPEDVLRLVEVARAAKYLLENRLWLEPTKLERRLIDSVKGMTP